MIGGNPNDFLNRVYSCQDTIFVYKRIKCWFQGYMPDDNSVHMEVTQYEPPSDREVWSYDAATIDECWQAFIKASLFNGKSFWEIEQDIEWVDN